MRKLTGLLAIAISIVICFGFAAAQEKSPAEKAAPKMAHKKAELSDAQYTSLSLSAAPKSISKDAGVVRPDKDGSMKALRESKNGYTCMAVIALTPMCADANSMAFFDAYMKKENPPDKLGVTYMLGGDKGASNTDPWASGKTADNHWVVTGPHIMVVGPAAKSMGLPDSADADPTKPYLMWANTPYAHAMIPTSAKMAAAMAKTDETKKADEAKK